MGKSFCKSDQTSQPVQKTNACVMAETWGCLILANVLVSWPSIRVMKGIKSRRGTFNCPLKSYHLRPGCLYFYFCVENKMTQFYSDFHCGLDEILMCRTWEKLLQMQFAEYFSSNLKLEILTLSGWSWTHRLAIYKTYSFDFG